MKDKLIYTGKMMDAGAIISVKILRTDKEHYYCEWVKRTDDRGYRTEFGWIPKDNIWGVHLATVEKD